MDIFYFIKLQYKKIMSISTLYTNALKVFESMCSITEDIDIIISPKKL